MIYGMDFGDGKSETVIYESCGKGRFKVRYDLPDDPNMRSYSDLIDDLFRRQVYEFCAKRVKKIESEIFAWIKRHPICYMNPCVAILDGVCHVVSPGIFPRDNVFERYDVSELFIQFPRALPTELKGIAV